MAKYDASGDLLWAKRAGGEGFGLGYGIAVDAAGNSYVTGGFGGTATFGPGETNETTLTSAGGDAFVAKYDASGDLLWAKRAGGIGSASGFGIAVNAAGNSYVTGGFSGAATFGPGETNETTLTSAAGSLDMFVAKYDASGDLLWAKRAGSSTDTGLGLDAGLDIAVDGAGNSYVTGKFRGAATFGPGETNETTLTSAVGSNAIFVAKHDASGDLLWAKRAGGEGFDLGVGIAVDGAGNSYVTGQFGSAATFGPGETNETTLTSAGGDDIFVAKLGPDLGDHQITGVLDAAGFQALISPGSIVSVFGNFVETTVTASSIPLSETLNGFSVTFNDIPGALFGVFDGAFDQSNVQAPWNVDVSSGKVEVKIHWKDDSGEVWSNPFEVDAALASPGIFMFPPGTTRGVVTNFKGGEEDDVIAGSWAQPPGSIDPVVGQPAAIGGVVTIWCSGLGPVSPRPVTGDIPAPGTVPVTDKIVRVFVGGVEAQVLAAVLQPQNVGLNQINLFIPEGVTPGDAVPIVIEVECADGTKIRSREDVTIAVRQRHSRVPKRLPSTTARRRLRRWIGGSR